MISDTGYSLPIVRFNQEFNIEHDDHPIFFDVQNPYISASDVSLTPLRYPNTWFSSDDILLDQVTVRAQSTDNFAAILTKEDSQIRTVYFTHYPSQNSNEQGLQLLYNAFLWADFRTIDMGDVMTTIRPFIIPISFSVFTFSLILFVSICKARTLLILRH